MDSAGWDARYEASELVWSRGPNQFLPPLVEGSKVGSALDLACGEGRNAIWLASQGWQVTAVDFSAAGIEKGKTLTPDDLQNRIEWVVADLVDWEPGHTFDLIAVFYLHLPTAVFSSVLERCVSWLAPGGRLVAVGHAVRNVAEGVGGPQAPEILWDDDLFRPALADLVVTECAERLRPVDGEPRAAIDFVVNAHRPDNE